MSSFIIDNKCMNRIINGLYWKSNFKDGYRSLYEEMNLISSDDFVILAKKLFKLNTDAFNYRYDENNKVPEFEWINCPVTDIQFLKSLHCLRYQCCEGNIPKRKLYKWLTDVINCMESYIVRKMPEYEKAEWG